MIRQRILYVGIGGSGLDLGIKLDEALRREICGLDGRALLRKAGPFASLKPNQLPNFVQSLYIDFASESLEAVTSSISGGNAVFAIAQTEKSPSEFPEASGTGTHLNGKIVLRGVGRILLKILLLKILVILTLLKLKLILEIN